jgi:hypothetical protein
MRAAILVLLVPAVALADGMPAGTWYVLRADGGAARCEAWTSTESSVTIGARTIELSSEGARVYLGSDCGDAWSVHEVDGELDVDGATWFHARATCEAAVRRHARVAMAAPACVLPAPAAPPAPPASTRATFERVLARGGTLYADNACQPVAVRVDERTTEAARGHFVSTTEDADWRTTTSLPYDLTFGDDKVVTTSSETKSVAKHAGLWPGGSYGCICADDNPLTFGEDWAEFAGTTYYFSARACRRAAAAHRGLASWYAPPDR